MVPLLCDEAATWREYLFAEYHSHYPPIYFPQRTVRDARFKLIVNLLQDRVNPVAQPKEPVVTKTPSYVTPSDLAGSTMKSAGRTPPGRTPRPWSFTIWKTILTSS